MPVFLLRSGDLEIKKSGGERDGDAWSQISGFLDFWISQGGKAAILRYTTHMARRDRNPEIGTDWEAAVRAAAKELCSPSSFESVSHRDRHDVPMPSVESLDALMEKLLEVLFPGYFGHAELKLGTMEYHIGALLDEVYHLLAEQVERGFCFACAEETKEKCPSCRPAAGKVATQFVLRLSEIRRLLATDVRAAFDGDPAAKSPGEAIFCYPSIRALSYHRVAHELYLQEVPLIPRIISELAHSATGIDIHPGATIGEGFFMDHGTGIVIGETTVIGRNVRLYQGVTLGARSFPLDADGNPVKGIARHPIVEDDVIVYSGATILGRVTIGKGSVVGGNVWLTKSLPPGSRIAQNQPG